MRKGPHKNSSFTRKSLRNRRGISVIVVLAGLIVSLVAGFPLNGRRSSLRGSGAENFDMPQQPFLDAFSGLLSLPLPHRQIFPYSIVPGGVKSPQEIKEAVARDPVVAKHYSALQLKNLRLIRLNRARAVYVSYRVGGSIYWTRRKLELAEGESLLTDGRNTLRTRCGNLISETPRRPNLPAEPTSARFDTPLIPEPPMNPEPPLVLVPPVPGGSVIFPPFVPIFPGGGSPPPNHPPEPPPPPVHVPEPSTTVLLLTGLTLLWVISKLRDI